MKRSLKVYTHHHGGSFQNTWTPGCCIFRKWKSTHEVISENQLHPSGVSLITMGPSKAPLIQKLEREALRSLYNSSPTWKMMSALSSHGIWFNHDEHLRITHSVLCTCIISFNPHHKTSILEGWWMNSTRVIHSHLAIQQMPVHPSLKLLGGHRLVRVELLKGEEDLNPEKVWWKGNEDVWPGSRELWPCLKMSFQLSRADGIIFVLWGPKRRGDFSSA